LYRLDARRHGVQWQGHDQFVVVFLDLFAQQFVELDFTRWNIRFPEYNTVACGFKAQEFIVIEVVAIRNFPANFHLVAGWRAARDNEHIFEIPDFIEFDGCSRLGQ